jgi:hypothetical protein
MEYPKLQAIINANTTLTFNALKADRGLVIEIQIKLSRLGFYPGGGWIDGDLGNSGSFTRKGLSDFCTETGVVPTSGTIALDPSIAQKLIDVPQVNSVLNAAATTSMILGKLKEIQKKSLIVNANAVSSAFVSRTINNSPFQKLIDKYPEHLKQKPNGVNVAFTNDLASFSPYPDRGRKPTIDMQGLNFLAGDIGQACVCIGGFADNTSPIQSKWLGRDAFAAKQFWSATKFIGVLNTVDRMNDLSSAVDIDNCKISGKKFNDLVKDMVSLEEILGSSNAIAAMFKRFTQRQDLEKWLIDLTGNSGIEFRGFFGEPPLFPSPVLKDSVTGKTLNFAAQGVTGDNAVSAYDLVRLISMLGWHQHLTPSSRLPAAQWTSLESVVRAMGFDTSRYVDVALETLGLVDAIAEPVVISKVGFGNSNTPGNGAMTYVAFVKFVDRRTSPGQLRTFALALRCPGSGDFDSRDTGLAAAVTEIVRRIVT